MTVVFGVDIGGTQTKLGAFSPDGTLLQKWSIPTDLSDNGTRILPHVADEIRRYLLENGIPLQGVLGIGLGIPGPVDDHGYVRTCVNLHWTDFRPALEMRRCLPDLPVSSPIAAGNDANVAALGEYARGGGAGSDSMMMVTLGTGVGGGVILGGKILGGAHGLAGEIGHIATNAHAARDCECGNRGCINECSSATGIVAYTGDLLRENPAPSALRAYPALTAEIVCRCAKEGDELALSALRTCMEPLGIGLAHFSHAIDPQVYVIGGGVSHAGEFLVALIRKAYEAHMHLTGGRGAEIRLATLGNDAGIIGACMLALTERGAGA